MEHIQQPSRDRRNTVFSPDSSDIAQLKSEHMLLQRKFDRLEQKEKRMQVGGAYVNRSLLLDPSFLVHDRCLHRLPLVNRLFYIINKI